MATYALQFPDGPALGQLAAVARRTLAAAAPPGAPPLDQEPDEVVVLRWTLDFFWLPALRGALEESKRQEVDQVVGSLRATLAQAAVQPLPVQPTARRGHAR